MLFGDAVHIESKTRMNVLVFVLFNYIFFKIFVSNNIIPFKLCKEIAIIINLYVK